MTRVLHILLLTLLLTLGWGAGRAADAGTAPLVPPAQIVLGERLMLYSYSILGVEVRSFTDEEFEAFYNKLKPYPRHKTHYSRAVGKPASLFWHQKTGLVITRVVPGSPAEASGIRAGDVLIDIGASQTSRPEDLLCVLRNCSPGTPLHMWLIDEERNWKCALARPVERPEPAAVGYIIPRKLCATHRQLMQRFHAKAIQLLAMEHVPVADACDSLEAVCRIIYKDHYTPGSLRIPLRRTEGCTITATRNGWDIDVIMEENGVVTKGTVRRWLMTPPASGRGPNKVEDGPNTLPEAIRRRLQEIDTTGADKAPKYDSTSTGTKSRDCCSK